MSLRSVSSRLRSSGIAHDKAVKLGIPRYPAVASLRGCSASLPKPLSPSEMRDIAYEERLAGKYKREVSGTDSATRNDPPPHPTSDRAL